MLTEVVGIVDRAANDETFLVVKRANMGNTAQAEETKKSDAAAGAGAAAAATDPGAGTTADPGAAGAQQTAKAIKLPAAAKDTMLTGLQGALEKLAAVAEMVNGAEVDDAAAVPPELTQSLGEVAATLTGMAGAQGDMKAAGDAAAQAGIEKAELDAYTALHATVNAARERMWSACEMMSKDPAKASEEFRAVADMLASVSSMVPQVAAKAVVAKAARRMGKGRLALFKGAVDIMLTLLKEFEEEGEEAAAEAAGEAAAAAQSAAAGSGGALAKAFDALSSFDPLKLAASVGEVLSIAKGLQTTVTTINARVTAHDIALAKTVVPSNANVVENTGARAPKEHMWKTDLAAVAREEIAREKGK